MTMQSHPDPKDESLRTQGVRNRHPEKVTDEIFDKEEFFDPRDLVQVKYEMLRRVRSDGMSVSASSNAFGFSRPAFYQARSNFDRDGLSGLLPRKRGPKQAHKLTSDVIGFVEQALAKEPTLRATALAKRIAERFGILVHPRSIERALKRRKKRGGHR